ncbi:MAG: nucleotidyltransferase family protein [Holosporales bacterium]
MPETAFVLCAGFGKRMGPLTQACPKPLLPVWGSPLLELILERLAQTGIKNLVVNTHYLAPQVDDYLKLWEGRFERIQISHEPSLLETGGAIRQALPLLGNTPFWVVNGDVIFDPHESFSLFPQMAQAWRHLENSGKRVEALLGVLPKENAWGYEGRGDFFQESHGGLKFRGDQGDAPFVYTGVQILDPQNLNTFEPGYFSAKVFWDAFITKQTLYGFLWKGSWFHVGTHKAYQDLPPR